jgi:hypothetical protein
MVVYNGELVACGDFSYLAGNYDLRYLARWDGENWCSFSPTGNDDIDWFVLDVEVFQGDLYIAGNFSTVGGMPAEILARWDGAAWHAEGEEVWDTAAYADGNAMSVYNGALFVGGAFPLGPPWNTRGIMRWDGATWFTCGAGVNGGVYELQTIDYGGEETLYAGGWFSSVGGGINSDFIAAWQETPLTAVEADAKPTGNILFPCQPNPFNARTRIVFTLSEKGRIQLQLFDILGRELGILAEGLYPQGRHTLDWDGRDVDGGGALASGVYLLRLATQQGSATQKVVLAK